MAVAGRPGRDVRVPATVWLLGITSMLTDVSSEMVTAVLPLYLTVELTFTVLQFGLYDGLSQAVQGLVQIGGGVASDRRSNYKGMALGGYGASAVTRIAILFTGGAAPQTTALLLVDRVGKGIRTAARGMRWCRSPRRRRSSADRSGYIVRSMRWVR